MKRRFLFVLCLLAIMVASVAAQTSPTSTPTPTPSVSVVIGLDVFVRGGPGRQYVPVGKLVLGDRVTALSRNTDADWVLISYNVGYGWVRRDLATWAENIDLLPVIDEGNLTPSPGSPSQPQQTLIFLPTNTPVGNWVQLVDAPSGYVRAGPGRTYLRLGQLTTGDVVDPVGRDSNTTWIMIRFLDGFGWVRSDLVRWVDDLTLLPVVSLTNLTPTATFTATNTSTPTATSTNTATSTLTPTQTSSPTATDTPTLTYTPTVTPSPLPTNTPTLTHTATSTLTSTATNTAVPTATDTLPPTVTLTHTPVPATATPQPVIATETVMVQALVASNTPVPTVANTATRTPTPTSTLTFTPTSTETNIPASATALPTSTSLPTNTIIPPSATPVPATFTLVASDTAAVPLSTATTTIILPTSTDVPATVTVTPTTAAPVAQAATNIPPATPITEQSSSPDEGGGLPIEAIVGGLALLLVLTYIAFYWRGLAASERYAKGFVVHTCPACDRGNLMVETKQDRLLGIPRPRRTVRCTECRSVLREVGNRRWRYAVDPMENPALYKHYNGREIDDATLVEIERQPHSPNGAPAQTRSPVTPPSFTDEDTPDL